MRKTSRVDIRSLRERKGKEPGEEIWKVPIDIPPDPYTASIPCCA
jgi:hypothetical protein